MAKSQAVVKESDLFSEETELKRDLGLLESFSIVISRIIGSGIFRTGPLHIRAKGGTAAGEDPADVEHGVSDAGVAPAELGQLRRRWCAFFRTV